MYCLVIAQSDYEKVSVGIYNIPNIAGFLQIFEEYVKTNKDHRYLIINVAIKSIVINELGVETVNLFNKKIGPIWVHRLVGSD